MELGTKVEDKNTHEVGGVVPSKGGCRKGYVMVEFPNRGGTYACPIDNLDKLGMIEAVFDPDKCKKCIFGDGKACQRYSESRLECMRTSGGTKHPVGMYPECLKEQ